MPWSAGGSGQTSTAPDAFARASVRTESAASSWPSQVKAAMRARVPSVSAMASSRVARGPGPRTGDSDTMTSRPAMSIVDEQPSALFQKTSMTAREAA